MADWYEQNGWVYPASTDEAIQFAHAADVVEGEAVQKVIQTTGLG